jgi:TRAP-type C4-dicarboxylate transport system permease small subunit
MPFKKCAEVGFQAITAILMMFMVLLTLLQVISRYVFNASIPWTEELARLDLVYVTFFGSIVAFQRRGHLRVEVLVHALPVGIQKWLGVGIDLASMLVLGVVVWQGVPLLIKFWPLLSAALEWPTTVFYFPVVFCCGVLLVYTAVDVITVVRGAGDREPPDTAQEVSR